MLKSFVRHTRQVKIFDPTDSEHREYFYKFIRTNSWQTCPYQWAIDDDSLDIVHCINQKLLKFYMVLSSVSRQKLKKKQVS